MVEIRKIMEGLSDFGRKNNASELKPSRASIQTSLLSFKDFCSAAQLKATGLSMTGECDSEVGFRELP
jgi:hypothetical protein